jgi:DNA polymerase-3 subunit epsilon
VPCRTAPSMPGEASQKLTERSLTVFDVETTGLDTHTDRVVQFGHAAFRNGALIRVHDVLINPCAPIPVAASNVHRIYDSDIANAPTFGTASNDIAKLLFGTDERAAPILCAYNGIKYDVPLLNAEFGRHSTPTSINALKVLDPLVWLRFHRRHWPSRTLSAAAERLGCVCSNAHRASADAETTGTILYRMIEEGIVPDHVEDAFSMQLQLLAFLANEEELYGRFIYTDRENGATLRMGFGKHVGVALNHVPTSYLQWVLRSVDLPQTAESNIRSYV